MVVHKVRASDVLLRRSMSPNMRRELARGSRERCGWSPGTGFWGERENVWRIVAGSLRALWVA